MTRVIALSGGVGGAKLAVGLAQWLAPADLAIVANVGDDFEHLGLTICPDIDTLAYSLSGIADPAQGWGRADESWHFMATLEKLGGETWFRLGDRDLALHVERTRRLQTGDTLSEVTFALARRLGASHAILPASDDPIRTIVETDAGVLRFQDYFVRRRCEPVVRGLRYRGAAGARPAPGVLRALADPDLEAIVICPSNPFLSIDPVLAVSGMRQAIAATGVPVVAVSPVIAGQAVKGPTAKIMRELGLPLGNVAIARHYAGLADVLVIDRGDAGEAREVEGCGMSCMIADTLMSDEAAKRRLARAVLDAVGVGAGEARTTEYKHERV